MRILIDGHNLIGQMPDISLADPDDEAQLVARLRRYAARTGHKLLVLFDGGLPGGPSHELSGGGVRVVFAPAGQPADPYLIRRLRQVRDPLGWLIVTSDQEILQAANRHGFPSRRSEIFAAEMEDLSPSADEPDPRQVPPSQAEVDAWLREFNQR